LIDFLFATEGSSEREKGKGKSKEEKELWNREWTRMDAKCFQGRK